ncbi:MoaD/ThiS family protein [Fulvivirgaceae bacterium BMA10]|uniref:MoaD/ThiS family protein n=1 Tax=Splendidivirga corallicola TaxID=3051826 RepID=A0ABT8KYS6_9BACT|nr:MoaD/ThiS family protein [Fulvivirgaceae bacterium BMA10]
MNDFTKVMPTVKFTYALKRFYPDLKEVRVQGKTVAEVLKDLDKLYPKLSTYIVDDQGMLRKHVNIFIGNTLIEDKESLGDMVDEEDEIFIMQALSGG